MNMSRNVFVAVTVARSRTNFYFSQRLRQQKNWETCSFQGMLHQATIHATCVATKLRDKLQEKFASVTAPLLEFFALQTQECPQLLITILAV